VRDGSLLVRHEGGHVQGIEHGTGWRDEPAIWISAGAFSQAGIYRGRRRRHDASGSRGEPSAPALRHCADQR